MNDFAQDAALARKGDTEAFSRLYALVYKDLYHIALYSLKNVHDASDVVSDTVMDAFCSIKKLKDEKAFRSWIMRILSAKIKRRQKEYLTGSQELDENITGEFDYDSFELKEALENLDSESRLILSMSVLGGYTSEEIARICNMKDGSVRSRLSRIRQKLRMDLQK